MIFKIVFGEIEHTGDVANAEREIAQAGGRVVKRSKIRYRSEEISFMVEAPNEQEFIARLVEMGACVDEF